MVEISVLVFGLDEWTDGDIIIEIGNKRGVCGFLVVLLIINFFYLVKGWVRLFIILYC